MFGDYQGTRSDFDRRRRANLGIGGILDRFRRRPWSTATSAVADEDPRNGRHRATILQGQIFTTPPSTTTVNGALVRDPFPGNRIPANRFDPAAAKIMALFPSQTCVSDG